MLQHGDFDADERLDLLFRLGPSVLCQSPAEYRALAEHPRLERFRSPRLRRLVSTGDFLDPEVVAVFEERWGMSIADGYGQAETNIVVANLAGGAVKPGSFGRALPGHHVAVIDDQGNELPAGIEGDLAVRGRPPTLFAGYWEQPEETKSAFLGDWYLTGDVAHVDEEGYFTFVGRAEDVISSSGRTFGPYDVERVLDAHPAIEATAVVGMRDLQRGGHFVRAFVVARGDSGSEQLEAELRQFAAQTLPTQQVPREIVFIDALPTVRRKISRNELRERPLAGRPLWDMPPTTETEAAAPPAPPPQFEGEFSPRVEPEPEPEPERRGGRGARRAADRARTAPSAIVEQAVVEEPVVEPAVEAPVVEPAVIEQTVVEPCVVEPEPPMEEVAHQPVVEVIPLVEPEPPREIEPEPAETSLEPVAEALPESAVEPEPRRSPAPSPSPWQRRCCRSRWPSQRKHFRSQSPSSSRWRPSPHRSRSSRRSPSSPTRSPRHSRPRPPPPWSRSRRTSRSPKRSSRPLSASSTRRPCRTTSSTSRRLQPVVVPEPEPEPDLSGPAPRVRRGARPAAAAAPPPPADEPEEEEDLGPLPDFVIDPTKPRPARPAPPPPPPAPRPVFEAPRAEKEVEETPSQAAGLYFPPVTAFPTPRPDRDDDDEPRERRTRPRPAPDLGCVQALRNPSRAGRRGRRGGLDARAFEPPERVQPLRGRRSAGRDRPGRQRRRQDELKNASIA